MRHTVLVGRDALETKERGVERLPIGKANHSGNFLDGLVEVAVVGEQVERLPNAVFVDQCGVVLLEAQVDDGTDVACVGVEVCRQLLGRIVRVFVLFLDDYLLDNLLVELVHQFRTKRHPITGILFFLFSNVVFGHVLWY